MVRFLSATLIKRKLDGRFAGKFSPALSEFNQKRLAFRGILDLSQITQARG
jgi:hypothetical protein